MNLRWSASLVAAILVLGCSGEDVTQPVGAWVNAEATVMEHERLIAACMAARGWEYVPTLPADVILQRETVQAELQGLPPPDPSTIDLPADPNDEIVAQLGPSEQEARAVSYWGDIDAGGSDPGCYRSTYEQAWAVDPFAPELEHDWLAMEQTIEADPRVLAAVDEYRACVAAEGFSWSHPADLVQERVMRVEELGERERAAVSDADFTAEREAMQAEFNAAFEVHDGCVSPYDVVTETVRDEYVREHGLVPD